MKYTRFQVQIKDIISHSIKNAQQLLFDKFKDLNQKMLNAHVNTNALFPI